MAGIAAAATSLGSLGYEISSKFGFNNSSGSSLCLKTRAKASLPSFSCRSPYSLRICLKLCS